MNRLTEIISVAESLSDISEILKKHLDALEKQEQALRAEFYKKILPMSRQYAQQKKELERLVGYNPQHFIKPRTIEVKGVKFGMKKTKGKLIVEDKDQTIEKIKSLLKGKEDILIEKKESLVKASLSKLAPHEMAAVGVKKEADNSNAVFIQIKSLNNSETVLKKLVEDFDRKLREVKLRSAS